MANANVERLRFETLRVGVAHLEVGGHAFETDVRILLASDGAYRVLAGGLSEPLTTLEHALRLAEDPPGLPPEASRAVHWRSTLSPADPEERPCPVCQAPVGASPRYPRQLCPACVFEATDIHGRPLRFGNTSFGGGFEAWFADDGARYSANECFVRGLPCRADEHRFGGIVVQLATS